jgi:hypothetical protein
MDGKGAWEGERAKLRDSGIPHPLMRQRASRARCEELGQPRNTRARPTRWCVRRLRGWEEHAHGDGRS